MSAELRPRPRISFPTRGSSSCGSTGVASTTSVLRLSPTRGCVAAFSAPSSLEHRELDFPSQVPCSSDRSVHVRAIGDNVGPQDTIGGPQREYTADSSAGLEYPSKRTVSLTESYGPPDAPLETPPVKEPPPEKKGPIKPPFPSNHAEAWTLLGPEVAEVSWDGRRSLLKVVARC